MSKILKLIKQTYSNNHVGELGVLHVQYGYHHGNQCQYFEACVVGRDGKYFKNYQQLFYLMDNVEIILDRAIEKLKDYNIEIDEIQLLTEADIAIEEVLSDET